jgi:hemerythrin-like domain-containing protein
MLAVKRTCGMVEIPGRRRLVTAFAAVAGSGLVMGAGRAFAAESPPAEVNPTEDLMREHGVLRRVLLVYRECIRRVLAGVPPPADSFAAAAVVIRDFIEAYHERLEEDQVFPRLEKAGKLTDLTRVLRDQHGAGRRLTRTILAEASPGSMKTRRGAKNVAAAAEQFIRIYEPHSAREDTVLFPAFHDLFTEKEFDELGDSFEEKEHEVLGSRGFEGTVETVAQLERALGIYDLAQFTPR